MSTSINAVVEYNPDGYLVYLENYPGAFVRGRTKEEAFKKTDSEAMQYLKWSTGDTLLKYNGIKIVQEKFSPLQICDADTDILFNSEKEPLTLDEYDKLKALVIKSAHDFKMLYESIPDKNRTCLEQRETFYGQIPRTAEEMYNHTNDVTNYYIGEIGIPLNNLPDILDNRIHALRSVEAVPDFLANSVFDGSYGEQWSLKKVLRRFIWHDRIHAKAMYRMASKLWGNTMIQNPLYF